MILRKRFSLCMGSILKIGLYGLIGLLAAQHVGIGVALPTERLHVAGNLRLEGAFMPGNNPGVAGQVLVSQGASTPPTWQNLDGWLLVAVDVWNPTTNTNLNWTCTGCSGTSPWLSDCGTNLRMLGGYNICGSGCFFEKTFTDLPAHSEVFVEVMYFSVDSWDQVGTNPDGCVCGLDHVRISLDGTEQVRCYPPSYGTTTGVRHTNASVCGQAGWLDFGPFRCTAYAAHSQGSLTIRITSGLNQVPTDESLGILAVKLSIR